MTSQARVIMAPTRPTADDQKNTSIFLAGTTSATGEPDWRETLTQALSDHAVTIFNPKRDDWDSTWKEDFSDKRWEEQIWWELDMQEAADIIVLFFHGATAAPISLLELGLAVKSGRAIVCVMDDYSKRGNVEAVCRRYRARLTRTEEQLKAAVLARLTGHAR
ncbi:hypothetical protein LCI18_007968 [Fusarium solani-melongenae]|uniref:Uncharacterized protein n=1 Tax=Fusarium solani subsp. cucurbitae TaxID=2747967 RepID=A0ACD3Z7I6_FUSSC|nr:hypothetical protein LCI18_007968 [Fusarium solani-melongenae]